MATEKLQLYQKYLVQMRFHCRLAEDWLSWVSSLVMLLVVALLLITHGTRSYSIEPSEMSISSQDQLKQLDLEVSSKIKIAVNKSSDVIMEELDKELYYAYKRTKRDIQHRVNKVRTYCNANNWTEDHGKYTAYRFPQKDIVWCPSFKAGSSTWRDFFIEQTGSNPFERKPNELHMLDWYWLLKPNYVNGTHPRKPKYEDYYKRSFTQIRHPIDRLLSLYESTCVYQGQGGYHESMFWWGIQTILRFRQVPIELMSRTDLFAKELNNWAREKRDGLVVSPLSKDNPYTNPPHPLLGELVSYMMWKNETAHWYDGHWYPVSEWCDLCQNNFTYITKAENKLELWYLLETLGLKKHREFFLHKHNPSDNKPGYVVTKSKDRYAYLDYVTKAQRLWLKDFFKQDFSLFDYDDSMLG